MCPALAAISRSLLVAGLWLGIAHAAAAANAVDQVPQLPSSEDRAEEIVGADQGESDDGRYDYRIGPDDELQIEVRDAPEISGPIQVRPDGRISLPLVGEIVASGKTTSELRADLVDALREVIRDPFVTVTVLTARGTLRDRIRVIGEAVEPRALPYRDGITALTVLTEIGGLPPTAAGNSAYILRQENGRTVRIPLRLDDLARTGSAAANRSLEPGDVIVVPVGFFEGEWDFTTSLGGAVSYTDNLTLAPMGSKDAAIISEAIPGLNVTADTQRLQAALDAVVRVQFFSQTDFRDTTIAPDVRFSSNAELAEDVFFLDAAASVSREVLDTRAGRSVSDANIQNQELLQVYELSPYLVNRIGRFASVETRYRGILTLVDADTDGGFSGGNRFLNDSFENRGELRIESGPRFSRLNWSLSGQWSHIDRENRVDTKRREALFRAEYSLSSSFALIGVGGYQNFEGDFSRDVDDPVYLGGFRWTPSSRTRLEVTAGQEDGDETINADFSQRIGESLLFTASYDERIALDQERLAANLPGAPSDLDGFTPRPGGLSLLGRPSRTETARAEISGDLDLLNFALSGAYEKRDRSFIDDAAEDLEEVIRINLSFSRPLSEDFVLSASGEYEDREFPNTAGGVERADEEYRAFAGLRFLGFRAFTISLDYGFSKRDSTLPLRDFTENVVTLTATATF